jgi:hypothetical protein
LLWGSRRSWKEPEEEEEEEEEEADMIFWDLVTGRIAFLGPCDGSMYIFGTL